MLIFGTFSRSWKKCCGDLRLTGGTRGCRRLEECREGHSRKTALY